MKYVFTCTLAALALCLTGCFAVPPMTFTIDVDSGQTFGPGALIPAGTAVEDYELVTSDFIGIGQLFDIARQRLGSQLFAFVDIDQVELLETIVTATRGNFDTLKEVRFDLRVAGSAGEFNTSLGSVQSDTGLGTQFVLVPEEPVDLLFALNPGAQTPPPAVTQFAATVSGAMPAQPVTFDTAARLRVTVSLALFKRR
jgi:hypothetical protein